MVAIALVVNGHVQGSIIRAVTASEFWAPKFREVSTLGSMLVAVDAPGNEVFSTGDLPGARARLAAAHDTLQRHLAAMRVTLPAGMEAEDSARILKDLTIGEYIRFEGRHIIINSRLPAKY